MRNHDLNPRLAGEGALHFPKVGVVGAGVMGRGLAQALAQTGHLVVLLDISEEILSNAVQDIRHNLKLASLFDRATRAKDHSELMTHVTTTINYGDLEDADFVIENATEEWQIKEAVYRILDTVCAPNCVLAANTSAIPIGRIASVVADPSRVLGMHFMNPVPQKPIVEVIRGPETSEAAIAAAGNLLADMGKRPIVVRDSPGFVTNRVLMLTINEAIAVVHEGVAAPREVDEIFVGCFAHASGPLATADLIGLDTILRSLQVLRHNFADPKFNPSPLLVEMVEAGRLGRKSGIGFFDYRVKSSPDGRS